MSSKHFTVRPPAEPVPGEVFGEIDGETPVKGSPHPMFDGAACLHGVEIPRAFKVLASHVTDSTGPRPDVKVSLEEVPARETEGGGCTATGVCESTHVDREVPPNRVTVDPWGFKPPTPAEVEALRVAREADVADRLPAVTPEPPPVHRPSEGDIQGEVIADLKARREDGIRKYGTPLQAFNGRDAMVDAYQEVLDLACYLRQEMAERGANDWHSDPGGVPYAEARLREELRLYREAAGPALRAIDVLLAAVRARWLLPEEVNEVELEAASGALINAREMEIPA